MKAVLISIKPQWCELIASGKKTIEVRKTKPKLETPFKVYIYETQGRTETPFVDEEGHHIFKGRGQVIGEFVCDRVIGTCLWRLKGETGLCAKRTEEELNLPNNSCLTMKEIEQYAGSRYRGIYAWHISDLVIYDKPRELSEFKYHCRYEFEDDFKHCSMCDYYHFSNTPSSGREEWCGCDGIKRLTRPPQSWCYVESEDTE